jgi:DNA-directed RNA polymerase subunit H (RpoH/RPB5)
MANLYSLRNQILLNTTTPQIAFAVLHDVLKNTRRLHVSEITTVGFTFDHDKYVRYYSKCKKEYLSKLPAGSIIITDDPCILMNKELAYEFFTLKELSVNPLSNRLSGAFKRLDEKEKADVIAVYGDRLGGIPRTDIKIRLYGFKPGDFVTILRTFTIGDQAVMYPIHRRVQ